MSLAISVKSLSKRYILKDSRPRTLRESVIRRLQGQYDEPKTVWALKGVTFDVPKGRTVGVIGHNGAGKSTLLRLICGVGRPTEGRIQAAGPIHGLLQLTGFHPLLSGRENIKTAGILSGLTLREVTELEDEMIAFAELEDFIDQPVRTYSDGMVLRLAFSAAVHLKPEILVIDEILTVGDIQFKKKCEERLALFRLAGKTLVLTSHSTDQIRQFCDEVIVLEEGHLVFHGDPTSATKHYKELMLQRTEKRAARVSGGFPLPPVESGSRMGTQEASISAVRIYEEQNQLAHDISSGSNMTIEVDYVLNQPVTDFAIFLSIVTETDFNCFETNIPSIKGVVGTLPKETGSFKCSIPALPLLPGRYFVNIGLYPTDWGFHYDYHWQMHPFQVAGEISNVAGIVSVHPEWSAPS